jgi:hypothetical protein
VRALALAILLVPAAVAAQPVSLDAVRERARSRGWSPETTEVHGATEERWCPRPPCAGLYERSDADLVAIRSRGGIVDVVLVRARSADGWTAEASIGGPTPTFHFRFRRGGETVDVGWEHRFDLPDGLITITGADAIGRDQADWLRGELDAYLGSPATFRSRALRRSEELHAHVRRVASAISICPTPDDPSRFVCVATSGGAHGMMDRCVRRRLTDQERAEMLARLGRTRERHEILVSRHAESWHAVIADLLALSP